jgi:hypothetical protein
MNISIPDNIVKVSGYVLAIVVWEVAKRVPRWLKRFDMWVKNSLNTYDTAYDRRARKKQSSDEYVQGGPK